MAYKDTKELTSGFFLNIIYTESLVYLGYIKYFLIVQSLFLLCPYYITSDCSILSKLCFGRKKTNTALANLFSQGLKINKGGVVMT